MDITKEMTFEDAIETYLIEHSGYRKGNPGEFDRNLALNKHTILAFLQETQPKEWERLQKIHGNEIETKVQAVEIHTTKYFSVQITAYICRILVTGSLFFIAIR